MVTLCGKLARGFKTSFVAVIHAPRSSVFAAFTDLILLAPGGKCVYNGPNAAASTTPGPVQQSANGDIPTLDSDGASSSIISRAIPALMERSSMPEAVSAYFAKQGFPAPEAGRLETQIIM